MKGLHMVTYILLVIGGLNWGLHVFGWDIATWGIGDSILKLVYILVGLSALVELFTHKSNCKHCEVKMSGPASM